MSRLAPFTIINKPYRTINGIPLEASILIPRSLASAPSSPEKQHPILVRWHGGGFVVGSRLYEPWFAQWLLDLAVDREAIIVSPDYRLLPESTGAEILDDVAHFWRWLQTEFPAYMAREKLPRVDVGNVLCCGESSGGFISVYCALNLDSMLQSRISEDDHERVTQQQFAPEPTLRMRAVISISAPLDATAPEYKVPRPRTFMGRNPPPPRQALAKIRAYIKGIPPGAIRTGCEPTAEMWELLLCIAQQAYLPRLFGVGAGNQAVGGSRRPTLEGIMETLEKDDREMVPCWLVHGTEDTMCPSVCSSGFAARLSEVQPEVPVHLTLRPGEHLFDVNVTRDESWVREGMRFLEEFWP